MVELRVRLQKEKEAKKKDNAYYADMVKRASSPSSKASYRKSKIDYAARHDRTIDSLKPRLKAQRNHSNARNHSPN